MQACWQATASRRHAAGGTTLTEDNLCSEHETRRSYLETNDELLKRITARPDVFGGKPIVRDMRISVELILSLLTQGISPEDILDDYPDLELDDIRACTAYAHAVQAGDTLADAEAPRRAASDPRDAAWSGAVHRRPEVSSDRASVPAPPDRPGDGFRAPRNRRSTADPAHLSIACGRCAAQ